MPLIRDFLVRMRDSQEWLESLKRSSEVNAVKEVLRFRLAASAAAYWTQLDLENIEELFSLASASSPSLTTKIQQAIAATLDHAQCHARTEKKRLEIKNPSLVDPINPTTPNVQWLEFSAEQKLYLIDPYAHHVGKLLGMFLNGKVQGDNTFITFNYDTVLERALERLGQDYGYALPGDVKFADSCKCKPRAPLNILKLHGSVNWARSRPGGPLEVFNAYADVRDAGLVPELVPPTWKKVFEDQLAHVWGQAVAALRSATRVIVIGFSIPPTDTHFKYLLAAGLQENISLREITFFNVPKAIDPLRDRASNLLRRDYIQSGLISFDGHGLKELASNNEALTKIGRPYWRPGEQSSIQEY